MNVLINGKWYFALEQENNYVAVEIPTGELPVFNEIFDNAHRTHGRATLVTAPYAYLHQEPNSKGKVSSKCKIGHLSNCLLESIDPNFHKEMAYAFFKYEQNYEAN